MTAEELLEANGARLDVQAELTGQVLGELRQIKTLLAQLVNQAVPVGGDTPRID